MDTVNAPEYSRNFGFWTEAEQQAILESRVAIAGVGGDGYQLGLKLARMGVRTFDIADPEVFEPENANRVPGASTKTYGTNKAEAFMHEVHEINPKADVRIFTDGVTEDNVDEFVNRATLVFDESELNHLEIGTALARAARERGVPVELVMNVGFAALTTSFRPQAGRNGKGTFERLMGIPMGMPLDEVKDLRVKLDRCLPYLPTYADIRTLEAVQNGAPLPSIAQGVDIASGIGASQAFLHMVQRAGNHRPEPVWSPRIKYFDAYNFKSGETRMPRLSHYRHLANAALKNTLKLNSKASYTDADRMRREQTRTAEQI